MIVILKHGVPEEKRDQLVRWFNSQGLGVDISKGEYQTILGLIGDVLNLDMDLIESLDIVQGVRRVTEPYKRCNRVFQPDDTIVSASGVLIGGGNFAIFAGPSSLESEEQVISVAKDIQASGANILIGGAVKSNATTYTIQDRNLLELEYLKSAKRETGMPIATEVLSVEDIPEYDDVDILLIGERNMGNYPLLCELGKMNRPVILKRSVSATLEEFLMAAEYIMAGGNKNIILCERGIRTFSDYTKTTLDISAIPLLKELSHLPVIADTSRSTGLGRLSRPISRAVCAAGADGIMIDVHNDPAHARINGAQAVSAETFAEVASDISKIREVLGR